MKKILKVSAIGFAILAIILVCLGIWKRDEIKRLLLVNSFFEPEHIVENFSNIRGGFLTVPLSRGDGDVIPLPVGRQITLPQVAEDWIEANWVTSLLVMKDGEIVFEDYYRGTTEDDLRISWSVAKNYLSVLVGVLHENGDIPDLDAPVTSYAPALVGGVYEGVTIRNVLQMSSGVTFDEDYLSYDSDINRMGRIIALGGSMDGFAAGLTERFQPPGISYQYNSIDTHVVAMVLRAATERTLAELMEEHVISKLGLEQDGYYITDGHGVAFALGGLNFTTRDFARFGSMMLANGTWNGQQIISPEWIEESSAASAITSPDEDGYGYKWLTARGAQPDQFFARGIYGQYIYIDQPNNVVVVATSADSGFRDNGARHENIEMFRTIIDGL